mmetsp:Transcript_19656/g.29343  ORF Transcript_19656/g.29343 Transcript_19656/m.29343 type:complete len:519 (+) Transcript_19656:106-1662(+)
MSSISDYERKLKRVEKMMAACESMVEEEDDDEVKNEMLEEEGYFQMQQKKKKLEKIIQELKQDKKAQTKSKTSTRPKSTVTKTGHTMASSPKTQNLSPSTSQTGNVAADLPNIFKGLGLKNKSDTVNCTAEMVKKIPDLIACIEDTHSMDAVVTLRKILSAENNPPVSATLQGGIMKKLASVTSGPGSISESMKFEIAWILTNLASGRNTDTKRVVNGGGLGMQLDALQTGNAATKEKAIWGLGKIAGDSPAFRDQVLKTGTLESIISVLSSASTKKTLMRNGTWALSNLCRGKPAPDFKVVAPVLSILPKLLSGGDDEVNKDALWALSYLSDDTSEFNTQIQAVIDNGLVKHVISHLSHASPNVQTPALRCVGNLVFGDDTQIEAVLRQGALPPIVALLSSNIRSLRKEAAWTLSIITADSASQIQSFIEAGGLSPIIQAVKADQFFDVVKEGLSVLSNLSSDGTDKQIDALVAKGGIAALCSKLKTKKKEGTDGSFRKLGEHTCSRGEKTKYQRWR